MMRDSTIKIQFIGIPACGKTSIAKILTALLAESGAQVSLNRVKYTKAKVSPVPGLQKLLNDIGPKLEVEIQILTEE